jgi:DHA2 family multidrug resistance protein-like MFS transporter
MTTTVPSRAGRREWVGLFVLTLACVLYAMDLTVLHLAVPTLSAELQPTSVELLWIIDIYGFMVAGFLVTMGALGDRIGRRKLLLIGSVAFAVLSIVAANANSPLMLIVSRALLGIAGATLAPSTLSLVFSMFKDPGQRSTAIGIWIAGFSAGGAIGPVLGGVLLEQTGSWGSVFLLAVPVMAVLVVLTPIVIPEYRDPDAGRLDLISALMSLVAILALIFGLKQLAQDGFGALPVASIVAGLAIGAAWFRRQLALSDPMIDVRLFRIPRFRIALLVNFVTIFVLIGYFLFVAQYLQLVLGLSPLEAGLWSVPSAIGFTIGSNLGPRLVRIFRPAHVIAGGLALGGLGLAALTQVGVTGGLATIVAASVITALGLAPVYGLTTELIVGSAPPERAGAASGVSETGGELGGALGLSVLGSVGVAIYRGTLTEGVLQVPVEAAAAARDTLGGAVAIAASLPPEIGDELLSVARNSFVYSMHWTAAISAVMAIGLSALSLRLLQAIEKRSEQGLTERPASAADDRCAGCGPYRGTPNTQPVLER